MADVTAIIPAAGCGRRMASTQNKQYMLLRGKPVLVHTLKIFESAHEITEIIIVVREDEIDLCRSLVLEHGITKVKQVVAGGKERQHSVWNGLKYVSQQCRMVVVHDGARPLLLPATLEEALREAAIYDAVVVGVPVKDTIKVVTEDGIVMSTPSRNSLWAVQTPQIFSKDVLVKAYSEAWKRGLLATDDAALVEALRLNVKMVYGSYENIKITTPEDLVLAEAFLRGREKV